MRESSSRYSYDAKDSRMFFKSRRYGQREMDNDLKKIKSELPLASRVDERVLERYLDTVHRNIFWYLINRRKQEKLYYLYMLLTLLLAALIPYSCYKIAVFANDAGVTSGVVTAQLTTILTGGIAFHRVITSWLFRRNTALEFWRAGTALKKLHAGLTERWGATAAPPEDPLLFTSDLAVTGRKAQAIINIETEAHFAAFSSVKVDLGRALASSAATSKILLDDFGGQIIGELKKAEDRQQARTEQGRDEQLRLIGLRADIKGLNRQLNKLVLQKEFIADREALGTVNHKIKSLKLELTEAEVEAAKVEARVAALTAATRTGTHGTRA